MTQNNNRLATNRAWGEFWEKDSRRQGRTGGCLPDGYSGIETVQRLKWQTFVMPLSGKPRILDLATGDGRVMRWIAAVRTDAKLVGVDQARLLPKPPRGTKIRPGIDIGNLPFKADTFDVVVSQFGFEYGGIDEAAQELARVLKPGGTAALLTHRTDGPIVAHNRARKHQIIWTLDQTRIFAQAKASLILRQKGAAPIVPPLVAAAPAEGARQFGKGSVAWEIAEAVRQTLAQARGQPTVRIINILEEIAAQGRNELARIESLEHAAAQLDKHEAWLASLSNASLTQVAVTPLTDGFAPVPFADFRIIRPL